MHARREIPTRYFRSSGSLTGADLSVEVIRTAIQYTYSTLDAIDEKLVEAESGRLAKLLELANLSSVIGNLVGAGIARASDGKFRRNGPHKYPDLLHSSDDADKGVELKVALEKNKPKGHLPKAGYYITLRYVLGSGTGRYVSGRENRGDVVWIWESKFGMLQEQDFAFSSTPGDSGKTAVIKTDAYNAMDTVFADPHFCPYPTTSKYYPVLSLFD
jgi:hypothetical protein